MFEGCLGEVSLDVRFLSIRAKGFQRIVVVWASPSVARYQVTGASLPGNSANSTWKHLAALEQSIGTLQHEIGKSIREVNENSTILLGLLQNLTQESKQTGLRMEMIKIRMDQIETKFDAHTALLNEHTRVLSDHSARFDRVETLLTQILARLPENPSKP